MNEQKVKELLRKALNKDLSESDIKIEGQVDKGENYLSHITFVTVSGDEELKLVVKTSEEDEKVRKEVPIREVFNKEIYVFETIKRVFEEFQLERGVKDFTRNLPHCFGFSKENNREVLVIENLRTEGYKLHERKIAMNYDHVKLVLEGYAKWHALSFALRDQDPKLFSSLTKNYGNTFCDFMTHVKMSGAIVEDLNKAKEHLYNNSPMLQKLNITVEDHRFIITDFVKEDPEFHVITHGDCWNNNFLFKYEESDKPVDVKILDWQCSGLTSPVTDLSHFLFSCASGTDLRNLTGLLRVYYNSFSDSLKKLGSDPQILYPFETFVRQWRKFSKYGLVMAPLIIKFALCESEDTPDMLQTAGGDEHFSSIFSFELKDETELRRRTTNVLLYADNVEK